MALKWTAPPSVVPWQPWRAWSTAAMWTATAHLALGIPATVFGGALVIAGLVISGVVLAVPGLGVIVLILFARGVRGLGTAERARFRILLGTDIPGAPPLGVSGGQWRDVAPLGLLARTRRGVLYWCLRIPVSMVDLVGLVVAWALPLSLLVVPAVVRADPDGAVPEVAIGPFFVGSTGAAWVAFAGGLASLLVVTPAVTRLLFALDIGLSGALLGPSATDLRTRVRLLETSRAGVVDAGDRERRRLERDLHDGAQQRLVALAMALGRAQRRLGNDSDPVIRSLLAEARTNAGEAITELRELARGLHPPVLTDHGLDAALAAVAARLPVPVTIDITALPRPTPTIEAVAYFVACEALTNIAKHANASRAVIRIVRTGDRLRLEVRDDGVGGADPTLGSGLKGIAERVSGVDGDMTLDSPDGGPTTLRVVLPCGS